MAISGNSIQQLGQALGQVTDVMVSKQQAEAERQQKQQSLETSNNIVQDAVSYRNKLIRSDMPSYLVDKQVKERIAKKEASYGLPIGTSLSTYKKHFEGYEESKNTETVTRSNGLEIFNKDTGEVEFIPSSNDRFVYDSVMDSQKSMASDFVSNMMEAGIPLSSRELSQASSPEGIMQLLANNEEVRQVYKNNQTAYKLEQDKTINTMRAESDYQADILSMRDNNYDGEIRETFQTVINTMKKNPNRWESPEQAASAFRTELNTLMKEVSPKAFNDEYGSMITSMENSISGFHKNTIAKGNYDAASYKAKTAQARVNAELSIAKLNLLDEEKTNVFAILDMTKNVDFKSLYDLASVNGLDAGTDLFDTVFSYTSMHDKEELPPIFNQLAIDTGSTIKNLSTLDSLSDNSVEFNKLKSLIRDDVYFQNNKLSKKATTHHTVKMLKLASMYDQVEEVVNKYKDTAEQDDVQILNNFLYKLDNLREETQ